MGSLAHDGPPRPAAGSIANELPANRRQLTLLDATCLMLGIVVGSAIFTTPVEVAAVSSNAFVLLSVWLGGGIASLLGALCFAELSTRYPEDGGSYAFLNRAYGSWAGLLFAWTDFWIVRPANAGAVAIVLGVYANAAWPLPGGGSAAYAIVAVLLATAIHVAGLQAGRWSQNLITLAKIAGLMLIVAAGFSMAPAWSSAARPTTSGIGDWPKAFVLVMFCYGGWSDLSNIAAEVREPARNLLRALVIGVVTITVTYLAINGAAVYAMGLEQLTGSQAFARDLVAIRLTTAGEGIAESGQQFVTLLVILSCLGSLSGVIFTGARVYYALGREHTLFAWLKNWDFRRSTPRQSLLAQALISCVLLAATASDDKCFDRLVIFAGPCYWGFMLLAALAVIILRQRDHHTPLPFRVPFYPFVPLAFALVCGLLVAASVSFVAANLRIEAWYTVVVIALGLLIAISSAVRKLPRTS